jgi:hypothetical protein
MGVDAKASAVLITMVVGFFAGRPSLTSSMRAGGVQKGANRVSAARLFEICKALDVTLASMFEDNPTA